MAEEQHEVEDDLTPDARAALESGALSLDAEDHEQDDDETYGQRVQKRIAKEVSKRKALADRLAETETNAERIARELKEAKERLNQYEERETEGLDTRAKELQKRRDAALEAGEMTEYNQLNDELTDIRMDMRDRRRQREVQPRIEQEQEKPRQNTSNLSPAAASWVEKNDDWLGSDQERAATAAKIERQLVSEGYKVTDPDLYEELDRRLNPSDGGIDDNIDDEFEEETPPQRGATPGVSRNTAQRRAAQRPGALTRADLQKMRNAGFDPDSAADRQGWIDRNKPL